MNKLEVQQRVLQYGKPLDLDEFEWDEKTRTFSSDQRGLVLDFSGIDNCKFITGFYCTFITGFYCTFNTGSYCTFNTSSYCTFTTGSYCIFIIGNDYTLTPGAECVIIQQDPLNVIRPKKGDVIDVLRRGYLVNGKESCCK